jgi:hypothetical protein
MASIRTMANYLIHPLDYRHASLFDPDQAFRIKICYAFSVRKEKDHV